MSDEERDQNFSFTGDSLNESFTRSLNGGNNGLPPKINPADYTISATNQVIVNQSSSNTPPPQSSSDSN